MAVIEVPRGNIHTLKATIFNEDETPHILSATEQAVFIVKKSTLRSDKVKIKKVLTADDYNSNDELEFTLLPSDTVNLGSGDYVYGFGVGDTEDESIFNSVVNYDTFRILPSVADRSDLDNG